MIQYDIEKIKDFNYIKDLLEKKFLKLDSKNDFFIYYIKEIEEVWQDDKDKKIRFRFNCYVINLDYCSSLNDYNGDVRELVTVLDNYSFVAKEEFLDGYNKLKDSIQKEIATIDTSSNKDFEIKDNILIDYTGYDPDILIPNGVIGISPYAFFKCMCLDSVVISNSVTSIGKRAFYDCSTLTSITIPNNIIYIGKDAFKYCNNLKNIDIPKKFKDKKILQDIGFIYKQIDLILNKPKEK